MKDGARYTGTLYCLPNFSVNVKFLKKNNLLKNECIQKWEVHGSKDAIKVAIRHFYYLLNLKKNHNAY